VDRSRLVGKDIKIKW